MRRDLATLGFAFGAPASLLLGLLTLGLTAGTGRAPTLLVIVFGIAAAISVVSLFVVVIGSGGDPSDTDAERPYPD